MDGYIGSLQTEHEQVAWAVIAHNTATALVPRSGSPEEKQESYIAAYWRIYRALKDAENPNIEEPPPVSS